MRMPPAVTGTVVLVVMTGCAGSSAPSASKASFRSKVQALCRTLSREGIPAPPLFAAGAHRPRNPQDLRAYQEALADFFERTRTRLAAIGAPAGKQAAFSRLLASLQNTAMLVRELHTVVGDVPRREALVRELEAASASGHQASKELGGIECHGIKPRRRPTG